MNRRSRFPEQLFVFAGSFLFFLCTLAANFSGPHDSIGYLNGIVKGDPLFHPHHLLYHFITHYWLVCVQLLLPGIKDYYLVETFTALWGSGIMTVAYSFFRRRFKMPVLQSAISLTVIAFSFGPWFYSTNIEVYAPPMFFLLLALYIISKPQLQQADVLKIALLQVLAILFHQVHILFTPVVLYKLWQQRKTIPVVPAFLKYAITGAVIVGGAYFMVGWVILGENSLPKWVGWLEGYAQEGAHWKPLNGNTPFLVATGYSHAFIGGHFVFKLPPVEQYLNTNLPTHSLGDEIYLVRNMSHTTAIILAALSLLWGAILIGLVFRFVRGYRTIHATIGNTVTPLMITGIVYSVFFTFWMPEILEFWIFQVILVWLLLLGSLLYAGQGVPAFTGLGPVKPVALVAVISIMLFVINFFGSIRWLMKLENDEYFTKIKNVKELVKEKDMILLQDSWQVGDFFKYFIHKTAYEAPAADSLRPVVDQAVTETLKQGGRIYIYTEASHYQPFGTVYIDSLLKVYDQRKKIFPEPTAHIVVIE